MYRTIKPFIKWAGGKSQLLNDIRKKYPHEIKRYCEPFVGGGAVLFDILENFRPQEVLINDINAELMNTYIQIQEQVETIILQLFDIQTMYWTMNEEQRKEYFYQKRDCFNEYIIKHCNDKNIERAVLFIFLNKTCFNGLYRVNKSGLFNVPIGSYKQPLICDAENLRSASKLLKNVQIKCGDYSKCEDFIDKSTFVYIDPPYRPLNITSSFTSYSKNEFNDDEQVALKHFIDKITQKGAKVVASNSDPKNENITDTFFDELYAQYNIIRVSALRNINSKGNGRKSINELLIYNF